MKRFLLEVGAALSAGVVLMFAVIVLTVAIFPTARDGLVREIVHAFNQDANQADKQAANQGDRP